MVTTPTNKPLGSSDPRDLLFNSEKFDEVMNSKASTYVDRKDNTRLTIKGLEEAAVSAGPTVEAAAMALDQVNEAKKNSDAIVAATEGYIEGAKISADEAHTSARVSEESAVKPYTEGTGARDWETPQAGILEAIHALCQREDSSDNHSFLMAGAGLGSRTIAELSKGTVNFERLKQTILNAVDVASRDSTGISLGGMFWVQGENDLANPDPQYYADMLMKLRSDIQKVRAINQDANLPLFSYQIAPPTRDDLDSRWGVPNGQLLAAELDPYIFIAAPTYWMTYNADGVHMPNWSYKLLGAYLGKAWKRVMIDRKKWRPLSPAAISYSGNQVDIDLHIANSGLVIEPGTTHAEFRLKDSSGYATITSVEIINDSSVRITASRNLSSPLQISYARQHDGKVRDTATEQEYIDIEGTRHPLHNYLVAFMRDLIMTTVIRLKGANFNNPNLPVFIPIDTEGLVGGYLFNGKLTTIKGDSLVFNGSHPYGETGITVDSTKGNFRVFAMGQIWDATIKNSTNLVCMFREIVRC